MARYSLFVLKVPLNTNQPTIWYNEEGPGWAVAPPRPLLM